VAETFAWLLEHPGKPATVEYRYACKDGHWAWMEAMGVNYLDDPSIRGIIANSRDISERVRAQEAARASERLFREMLENQGEGSAMVDPDERFLFANKVAETIFGVGPGALTGRSLLEVLPEASRELVAEETRRRQSGLTDTYELDIQRPSGELRTILVTVTPRSQVGGQEVQSIGVFRDITEARQAESVLQQLQESRRLESLGTLSGGVAHNMNNVLGAILGLASANLELQPPGTTAHRAFDAIARAATRGAELVRSLLAFASREPPEERVLDLNALLQDEYRLMEASIPSAVTLTLDLDPGLRPILGDPSALSAALRSLWVNASDAMPDTGHLTFRTRNRDPEWVEVDVEDTGVGMSPEVLNRAMEPFYTTKEVGKGTGLGLSMVYSTVVKHGGKIDLRSRPGKGTRVRMLFPVSRTPA
jgi:PAS domain S-box-containing protein